MEPTMDPTWTKTGIQHGTHNGAKIVPKWDLT